LLSTYRALLDDRVFPSRIVFAGESVDGGLAVATLVNAREHGLPPPAAAFVMSQWADLILSASTLDTKHGVDPVLDPEHITAGVPHVFQSFHPVLDEAVAALD
jgi:acetyl esterase/lipase